MFTFSKIFYRTDEKGASAVELALVLPILIMILFGIFQFGLVFNSYLAVTHAAREGARLASVDKYSESAVIERATPVTPTSVTINYPEGKLEGRPVTVTVNDDFSLEIPFFGTTNIPLSGSATMRMETS